MVSVCLPSDALLQHLPSYLGFPYLGHGVSLHGCSSKAQPLLLNLDEGYLLTATLPDLRRWIAPLGPPSHCSSGCSSRLLKEELPKSVGAQYATGDQWRNNSIKNEGMNQGLHHSMGNDGGSLSWQELKERRWPGGATRPPRSGGCVGAGGPRGAIPC